MTAETHKEPALQKHLAPWEERIPKTCMKTRLRRLCLHDGLRGP